MPKIVDGKEYLDYQEAAKAYGLRRSSVQSMVSRGTFSNTKFSRDVKAYISREQMEAYKHRKDKTTVEPSISTEKERSTQDIPFSVEHHKAETLRDGMAAIRNLTELLRSIEPNNTTTHRMMEALSN